MRGYRFPLSRRPVQGGPGMLYCARNGMEERGEGG